MNFSGQEDRGARASEGAEAGGARAEGEEGADPEGAGGQGQGRRAGQGKYVFTYDVQEVSVLLVW